MADSYLIEVFFLLSILVFLVALFLLIPVLPSFTKSESKFSKREQKTIDKWENLAEKLDLKEKLDLSGKRTNLVESLEVKEKENLKKKPDAKEMTEIDDDAKLPQEMKSTPE